MTSDDLHELWDALRPSINDYQTAASVLVDHLVSHGVLDPMTLGSSTIEDRHLQNALLEHIDEYDDDDDDEDSEQGNYFRDNDYE